MQSSKKWVFFFCLLAAASCAAPAQADVLCVKGGNLQALAACPKGYAKLTAANIGSKVSSLKKRIAKINEDGTLAYGTKGATSIYEDTVNQIWVNFPGPALDSCVAQVTQTANKSGSLTSDVRFAASIIGTTVMVTTLTSGQGSDSAAFFLTVTCP